MGGCLFPSKRPRAQPYSPQKIISIIFFKIKKKVEKEQEVEEDLSERKQKTEKSEEASAGACQPLFLSN